MTTKQTLPIIFSGGAYGTYLEWVLQCLHSNLDVTIPFTTVGNSHNYRGHHLKNMQGWREYVKSDLDYQFVRLHPKITADESCSSSIDEILQSVEHCIYLYPDHDNLLLLLNNWYDKVWPDWWEKQFNNDIDPKKILDNWPVEPNSPIPTWVRREFLSYHLMPSFLDQIDYNHLTKWQHPRACVVSIGSLLYDFVGTLAYIERLCHLKYQRPIESMIPYHEQNLKLQRHLKQDLIGNKILDAIEKKYWFEWDPLPLPSEAWLQWSLRQHGFELMCHELDIMPTNSVQLRKLLLPI